MSDNPQQSVYRRGANDGLKLGIFFIILFTFAAYSVKLPLLGFLAFAMIIAVPFVVYHMIKRDFIRFPKMRFFSALWMHGIAIFFFAAILLAAGMYVFLRFVEPTYIIDNMHGAIHTYRSMGSADAAEIADAMQAMIDNHMVPNAITFAITSIWTVVFTGSVLSLLLALLVRTFNKFQS